jgi:hypothetical protein
VVVLAVVGINFLLPQRSGPIDLTEAWEQFFVASALLAVLVVTSVARYGTQWVSLPEAGHAKVSVAAWNVEAGADASSRVVSGLSGIEVDMIGLEEFQPAMQDGWWPTVLSRCPTRFMCLRPTTGVSGPHL